jgi:hypothetical protein
MMTDYHDKVLENAKFNLRENDVSIAVVKKLDWNDVYEKVEKTLFIWLINSRMRFLSVLIQLLLPM